MTKQAKQISRLLSAIRSTPRIRILLGIHKDEVCVCHLEAILGWRQAYISQHLMALRAAGILSSRKEGRFVYYRLKDQRILQIIQQAADIMRVQLPRETIPGNCACPTCIPASPRVQVDVPENV